METGRLGKIFRRENCWVVDRDVKANESEAGQSKARRRTAKQGDDRDNKTRKMRAIKGKDRNAETRQGSARKG